MGETRPVVADPREARVAVTTTSAETRDRSVELYSVYFQTCDSKSRSFELKSIY